MAKEKSVQDIDKQYDRIKNRIHRYAIDDEISVDSEMKARKNLDDTYDRYQDNLAKALGYGSRVELNMARASSKQAERDYERKMPASVRQGRSFNTAAIGAVKG